jgi:hypothetical protein
MKSIVILIAIASIAILGFAPPAKSACSGCDSKAVKKEAPKAKTAAKKGCGGCGGETAAKKEAKKHECCGKDPFIMEANRMIAASEGKKSTGCACEDKANAKKAAKAAQPAKK